MKYIPSPEHWKTMYTQHKGEWSSVDKVPLFKIKIDQRLFSYPNPVDNSRVTDIINKFDTNLWAPIVINEEYYLLDGQHRFEAALQMNLNYIDVIIQHEANYSFYYGVFASSEFIDSRHTKYNYKITGPESVFLCDQCLNKYSRGKNSLFLFY